MRRLWLELSNKIQKYKYLKYIEKIKTSPVINKVANDKESWENSFISLWEPTLSKFSNGKSRIKIFGPQVSIGGKESDGYEGFARTFIGVAFYLHQKKNSIVTLRNGRKIDIANVYREGICNGTNKNHPEYWGKIKSRQRLVENASIAIGLLLTPQHIWNQLSENEKNNVAEWFKDNVTQKFSMNNWQWFKVFHYLFLEKNGYKIDKTDMEKTLTNLERMYVKDGWYSDGVPDQEYHYDYYVAWAMHFYALLFSYLAGNEYKEWKEKYVKRASRFMKDYQYFFTPGNHNVPYGRSQIYRFASLAPFGISLLLNCCNADLNWIKTSAIDTINTFLKRGAINKEGIFTMGYYDTFTPMLEPYSGPGSPYWAFKGFSPLLLPDNHPFWKIKTDRKSKTLIHSIPITKTVLMHDGRSQIIMLNAGLSNIKYPLKYNKFAYSNYFLMNFDEKRPFDNMLALKPKNGYSWHIRGHVLENSCKKNICDLKWVPYNLKNVIVRTILLGRTVGYVVIHQIHNTYPLLFRSGGFPISQNNENIQEQIKEDEVIIKAEQGEVGVKLIFGQASPFVHKSCNTNPCGKFSYTPCFGGIFNKPVNTLGLVIWANNRKVPMEMPSVSINEKFCKIAWHDEKHTFSF